MSLYIGAYYPDRQLDESLFSQSLLKVAANLAKFRKHPLQSSPPYLDIQFMMPGKNEKPDFEGMRMMIYDNDPSTLRIETVVPERMVNSTHTEDYVLAVMEDAVDNASSYFAEENMPFEREAYFELINWVSNSAKNAEQAIVLN